MFKQTARTLPSFALTAIQLFLLGVLMLTFCRILFYSAFRTFETGAIHLSVILKAFVMGMAFDVTTTVYALFLPVFLLILNEFFHTRRLVFFKAARAVTILIFWIYAFISAADFPYYKQFGSHLNRQAFLWAASPDFVLRLIFGNISYYGYLFLFLFFAAVLYKIIQRIFKAQLVRQQSADHNKTWHIVLTTLVLAGLMVLGARGRLSHKSTIHEGLALVSDNLFVNQVALNPDFTFFRSVFFQKVKAYTVPSGIDRDIAFARGYLGAKGPYARSVERIEKPDSAFRPYNVVIVCMESMSAYKMGIHGHEVLTPNFNSLIKESVYFDRFFSSGIHTFNGLFSTCTGYPCMLTEHGLRRYTRRPFTTLGSLLADKGYETFFYSTHDPVFDNMQGFFTQNGYKSTFSAFDLPREKSISVTGVPDHELFNLFFSTVNRSDRAKPFMAFLMTGSDHGPWAIPGNIPFKPTANSEEKRSTQYADWALGEFMKSAKKQSWYNNTLFVFLGDHGYSINGTYEMPLSFHHIPFVMHKPGTLKADTLHNLGYQPDVISTVAGVLNLPFDNSTFGINILKEKHPFVYFTADDKIGCVSDDGYYFYELLTQKAKRLRKYDELDQEDYYQSMRSKADSLEAGAKQLLGAAEYFIRKEYFSY